MCGIAGILDSSASCSQDSFHSLLTPMLVALKHRGPDGQSIWSDPSRGIALGHRHLIITDPGSKSIQPMLSNSGRYVISYNGEIYNFRQLKLQLENLGHAFETQGDTEVLLAALEHWGLDASLAQLDGMFAVAIWDRQCRELMLVRDRLGEKPLYYGWADGHFAFSSGLTSLRKHASFRQYPLNQQALAHYFQYGCIGSPMSIYQHIFKLPPASILRVRLGQTECQPETYWQLPVPKSTSPLDFKAQCQTVHQLLQQSISERLHAAVPVGAFLSGGIDSSLVAAIAQSQSQRPLNTFTIGFQDSGYDEAPLARQIASHLGCLHHELYLSGHQALDIAAHMADVYDEPFADSSQMPTFWVAQLAKRQVGVVLTGDGSDELFFGYRRYQATLVRWQRAKQPRSILRRLLCWLVAKLPDVHPWIPRLKRRLEVQPVASLEQLYRMVLTLAFSEPQSILQSNTPCPLLQFAEHTGDQEKMLSRMDLCGYLPNDILTKVDRATMAVGLEARAPFLSRSLVEFAFSLPSQLGKNKLLLKSILNQYLPVSLFDRPKQGFSVPLADWLRGPLKSWAFDYLDAVTIRNQGQLRQELVSKLWREHQQGIDHSHRLWTIVMFQQWLHRVL